MISDLEYCNLDKDKLKSFGHFFLEITEKQFQR